MFANFVFLCPPFKWRSLSFDSYELIGATKPARKSIQHLVDLFKKAKVCNMYRLTRPRRSPTLASFEARLANLEKRLKRYMTKKLPQRAQLLLPMFAQRCLPQIPGNADAPRLSASPAMETGKPSATDPNESSGNQGNDKSTEHHPSSSVLKNQQSATNENDDETLKKREILFLVAFFMIIAALFRALLRVVIRK